MSFSILIQTLEIIVISNDINNIYNVCAPTAFFKLNYVFCVCFYIADGNYI